MTVQIGIPESVAHSIQPHQLFDQRPRHNTNTFPLSNLAYIHQLDLMRPGYPNRGSPPQGEELQPYANPLARASMLKFSWAL